MPSFEISNKFAILKTIRLDTPLVLLKIELREAKPGGSKPGGFLLFSGKVQIVSQTLSGLFHVGAFNGARKRKRTNRENPWTIPGQIGKIPEKSAKRTKKKQKRKDKSRSGSPVSTPPPPVLAALD